MYSITSAVIGAGFIGPVHVEALRRLGIHVKGIMGIDPAESESARQALNLSKGYRDFDEVLNDPEVSVVHLAVPNVLHYELSKKALEAGKNVLCEKPLAMTSQESAELVELAASTGLHAGVCYNIRYYPLNLQVWDMIRKGELGDIHHVNGSYVQDWLLYDTDYNWRVLAEQGGALRAVADIGTHWMDLIHHMTGLETEAVLADLQTVHKVRRRPVGEVETFSGKSEKEIERQAVKIDTEDAGAILFRFKGGGRGTLFVSQVTAGRKNCLRYEIAGSKASVAWNSQEPNDLWIGRRDVASQALHRDPGLLADAVRPFANYPGGHNEGFPDAFKQCFRAFYSAVAGHPTEVPYPTFEDGHHEVVLCEKILESHRTQQWVSV